MELTKQQADRARGALVGTGVGDALGVPYEFTPFMRPGLVPVMKGGGLGPYRPGEWSDDTQMMTVVGCVAADGLDLASPAGLNAVATGFILWSVTAATDAGSQTRAVLGATRRKFAGPDSGTGKLMTDVARAFHNHAGRSAGNGSLMRTAPVALRYLGDPVACADAARKVSGLTHYEPVAGDACAIWCELIRQAILHGRLAGDWEVITALVPAERREMWRGWLAETVNGTPSQFKGNGYVVTAMQAAYAALRPLVPSTGTMSVAGAREALYRAVRAGNDTDTVAAIAGGLVGALAGMSALPVGYRNMVNGWGYGHGFGMKARDLAALADKATSHA